MKESTGKGIAMTVKKTNWMLYGLVSMAVLLLSWLIEKNVHVPSIIIIVGSIFALIFVIIISFGKPELALFILTAYFPFNKVLAGNFGGFMTAINLTNILILIVMLGWFSRSLSSGTRIFSRNTLNIPIILFCLFGFASLFRGSSFTGSDYFGNFFIPLKRWLTPIFLFFLAVNVIRTKEEIRKMTVIMMIAVTVAGLMAIYEYLNIGEGGSLDSSRVGGICEQPNMLGGFFVTYMFILVAFLFMNWRSIKYYLLGFPIMICIYGVLATFSRGAYLGLAAGVCAISYFKSKFLLILVLIYFICAYSNPNLLPRGMRFRLIESTFNKSEIYDTGIENQVDESARERIVIWKGAINMIKDYPFFGVGYGLFPYLISYYAPIGGKMDAHNTYLIIAAEMGIPTLIMFLLIFVILIKNARFLYRKSKDKFIRSLALGVLAGIFGLLVVNIFGSRMNSEEVSAYFWILAGLIIRAVIIEKTEQNTTSKLANSKLKV